MMASPRRPAGLPIGQTPSRVFCDAAINDLLCSSCKANSQVASVASTTATAAMRKPIARIPSQTATPAPARPNRSAGPGPMRNPANMSSPRNAPTPGAQRQRASPTNSAPPSPMTIPGGGQIGSSTPDARSLKIEIARVHRDNFGVYGIEKVWHQLKREGHKVGRDRVARLMDDLELNGVVRGKKKRTTVPAEVSPRPATPRLSADRRR
jgi:hypothetical protein